MFKFPFQLIIGNRKSRNNSHPSFHASDNTWQAGASDYRNLRNSFHAGQIPARNVGNNFLIFRFASYSLFQI